VVDRELSSWVGWGESSDETAAQMFSRTKHTEPLRTGVPFIDRCERDPDLSKPHHVKRLHGCMLQRWSVRGSTPTRVRCHRLHFSANDRGRGHEQHPH
jgi:hypothetical protein